MSAKAKPLSEQVVVLTGASSAIGLCTAQLAGVLGARLVLIAGSTDALNSLVCAIESAGGEAMQVAADVRDRAQVMAAARAAVDRFGRIDTWINNVGVSIYGRLDEVNEAESRHLFDVNFWGVVNGSLAALPHLAAAGGSLVNVGSEVGTGGTPLQGMYSSSKYAVKAFTDALRLEIEQTHGALVSIALIEPAAAGAAMDPSRVAEAILAAAAGSSAPPEPGGAAGEPTPGLGSPLAPAAA